MADTHGDKPRASFTPLTEKQIGYWREWHNKGDTADFYAGAFDVLCDMAVNSLLYAEEIERLRTRSAGTRILGHDWQPDGGVLKFETHPHGESPHVHTTCSKCGARAWFLEYQWELLAKGCPGAALGQIDPSGWDAQISKEIAPELERIASETRRAAHAPIVVGTPRSASERTTYGTRWVQVGWAQIERRRHAVTGLEYDVIGSVNDEMTEHHNEPVYMCVVENATDATTDRKANG